ncbi:MAG TPA: hypothetical protein VMN79_11720 [Casimicrobiaceae bacterium]|nr:hypothetical protein [Casimicrobiaceae bacterium]
MSQSAKETVERNAVVVSLQPGPAGTFRLGYERPRFEMPPQWSNVLAQLPHSTHAYSPSVVELDRDKLRRLQFSQAELAEIGFSLVSRLWALQASIEARDA